MFIFGCDRQPCLFVLEILKSVENQIFKITF